MNENGFYIYLRNLGLSSKVSRDNISRIKRVEKSIKNCDIDEEYRKDKCEVLLNLFNKNIDLEEIKKVLIGRLPIGSYTMNTYKYAIRKYVAFRDELDKI
ncbi:hypothetical protein EOM86_05065 [Candidatus Nomurabacteria bacterium]|nr:hypothetical protein [Candidatus Nomurabacteria bacterium]